MQSLEEINKQHGPMHTLQSYQSSRNMNRRNYWRCHLRNWMYQSNPGSLMNGPPLSILSIVCISQLKIRLIYCTPELSPICVGQLVLDLLLHCLIWLFRINPFRNKNDGWVIHKQHDGWAIHLLNWDGWAVIKDMLYSWLYELCTINWLMWLWAWHMG